MALSLINKTQLAPNVSDLVSGYGVNFFYPLSNPSGFAGAGSFLTTGQSGLFYSATNPSGFLQTGTASTTYATITNLASTGSILASSIRTLSGFSASTYATTGSLGANTSAWGIINPVAFAESLRANVKINGGGTLSVFAFTATAYAVNWTSRFIVVSNGNGTNFANGGYYDITIPGNGAVIAGVGGANNASVAGGVPLEPWQALYYILPIGGSNVSVESYYRIVDYTSSLDIPYNWVLIAHRNGDNGVVYFPNGINLKVGQSYDNSYNLSDLVSIAPVIYNTSGQWITKASGNSSYATITNLASTGSTLYSQITGLSGYNANTYIKNNSSINLTISGTGNFQAVNINSTGSSSAYNVPFITVSGSASGSVFQQLQNTYTGVTASTDISLYNDLGTAYLDIGINSSKYSGAAYSPPFTVVGPSDAYVYATGGNLAIGVTNQANINFFANGVQSGNIVMAVNSTGVYINKNPVLTNQSFSVNYHNTADALAAGFVYIGTIDLGIGNATTDRAIPILSNCVLSRASAGYYAGGNAIAPYNTITGYFINVTKGITGLAITGTVSSTNTFYTFSTGQILTYSGAGGLPPAATASPLATGMPVSNGDLVCYGIRSPAGGTTSQYLSGFRSTTIAYFTQTGQF